ncbi:MAG: peptidylprolyl isomerase [Chloroflexi bacterium]|nr:peptidylprolyl isomerase [Chloroflexota bacterium]
MPKQQQPGRLGRLGRVEREQRYNRILSISLYSVIAAVVLLLLGGFALEKWVRPSQPVAVVNGVEISTAAFQKRVRFVRRFYVQQYMTLYQFLSVGSIDPAFASQYQTQLLQIQYLLLPENIGRQVLDDLIEAELVRVEAERLGISVTAEELDTAIREVFFNYRPEGSPTQTPTATTAPTSTFSPTQLALITLTPTTGVTPTATLEPGVTITPTIVFPTPTMQSTEAFGIEFADQMALLKEDIGWSEQDLRDYAEIILLRDRIKALVTADLPRTEEQVWARHILVADEATAQEVLDRLAAGEDWVTLALEYSQDTGNAARGGDLGWFNRAAMVTPFADAAFSLEVGQTSQPVQSDFGFHIIQVLGHEERPLAAADYDQAQETAFGEWLAAQRAAAQIEEFEYWLQRTPTDPAIPPGAILQ